MIHNVNTQIEEVCGVELPIGETLHIWKNRITPVKAQRDNGKRISIVTGIHGDELEGQYICYEVIRRIKEHPECLTGTVDIYPAMNPLGIDSVTRGIPGFDLDMNRVFPGSEHGTMTEYIAHQIIQDLSGADLCVDIHASNIYLTEIPQIRINKLHKEKLLVVEAGVGMRITKQYCRQLADGLFHTMQMLGIWQSETEPVRKPYIAETDESVIFFNAPRSGIFIPVANHWQKLEKGQMVGQIVDSLRGEVLAEVVTPESGILFTIREYPVVDEGSLIGRLLVTA